MAKANMNTKDLAGLKTRLGKGALTKADVAYLNELIGHASNFTKAVEASKLKIGNKKIISKLPFGMDIVK